MECEKLAQEKTEMQRHYVMVSSVFACKWVFAGWSDLCASIPLAVKLAHYCTSQSHQHMRIHICVLMSTQLHMHIMIYIKYICGLVHTAYAPTVTHIGHLYTLIRSVMQTPMHTRTHNTHKVLS